MYANTTEQYYRKLNYLRFKKLTENGYSIDDENSASCTYTVSTDPFLRPYYTRYKGASIHREPVTGARYQQEQWQKSDFIIDNKTQLVNKVSADLVVGKDPDLSFKDHETISEDMKVWLEDFENSNHITSVLLEGAIQTSSLGDYYFEVVISDQSKIEVRNIDPYNVDIIQENGKVLYYEIAYEIIIEEKKVSKITGNVKTTENTFVQKKCHYPGFILYTLYEIDKNEGLTPVILSENPANKELIDRALTSPHMVTLVDPYLEKESDNINDIYAIKEYTGIDTPLLIHWPNYRMFGLFGVSDNGKIESLQNAINNRKTQINLVLDKHADPSMYGPDDYQDSNGNLTMSGGGSTYFPVIEGGLAPGYLDFQSHLDDAQKEVDALYVSILENSEVSPALVGKDSGGIESGRALMYKLMRSLCMAARKLEYMKEAIKEVVLTAQKMKIVWIDGNGVESPKTYVAPEFTDLIYPVEFTTKSAVPVDRTAIIEDVAKMIDSGIVSQETAVLITSKLFEEIEPDEEIKKLLKAISESFNKQKDLLKAEIPDYLKETDRETNSDNNDD